VRSNRWSSRPGSPPNERWKSRHHSSTRDIAAAERANLSAGPTRLAMNHAGFDAVRKAFTEALEDFVQSDGSVRFDNVFRVVIAHA
jgi:hypothetical protein